MLKSVSERKMTDRMKDNIMDAELAIQRELAYRQKVITLQRQNGDPVHDFFPLQAKVQPTGSSPASIQIAKADPCESLISASSQPRQPAQYNNNTQILNSQSRGDNLFCEICQVSCSGSFNYRQHLKGHKHTTRVKEMQLSQNIEGAEGASNRIWCALCKIWCMNQDAYGQHLNGQKHQKAEFTNKHREPLIKTQKYCGLCEIWCTDDTTFKMHLQGKNHVFKLQTMENRRRDREEDDMAVHWP